MTSPAKSGVKTSELYVTIATVAANLALAVFHVNVTHYIPAAALVLANVVPVAYVLGRTALKMRLPTSVAAVASDAAAADPALAEMRRVIGELRQVVAAGTANTPVAVSAAPPTVSAAPAAVVTPA
jgi:hypothetical protein